LLKGQSDEFQIRINELRQNSFKSQTDYLERVFNMIDHNDNDLIQRCLYQNEKSSYEWCMRFKVPTKSL
jgi:hypothetical protein